MVKIIALFYLSILIIGCSNINDRNGNAVSLSPKSIQIESNGSYSDYISSDETVESCQQFIVNEKDVAQFFNSAKVVALEDYSHNLTASNCHAEGRFFNSDGMLSFWAIDQARRGLIKSPNGDVATYYYCAECDNILFYESCAEDCL